MAPGSQRGPQTVVANAVEARDDLLSRGTEVSEIDSRPWGEFASFADPDGSTRALQQIVHPS